MAKYYYKKGLNVKRLLRVLGFLSISTGIILIGYMLFPIISWQIFFAPIFASQNIDYPIPKATVVGETNLASLITASNLLNATDYTNAENWFPDFKYKKGKAKVDSYKLSIPALDISNAVVSTFDNNLSEHLVNYGGSPIPPDKGNAVIFGHSTLPNLFNKNDYKTIFANLYKLRVGDTVWTQVRGVSYKYKIFSITVVDPKDTSPLLQDYNNNFLTLVTCTPPGTVWKRLILKAKLEAV